MIVALLHIGGISAFDLISICVAGFLIVASKYVYCVVVEKPPHSKEKNCEERDCDVITTAVTC